MNYVHKNFGGSIIVVDSSAPELAEENRRTINGFDSDNIQYDVLPEETSVQKKFAHATQMAKTKYTIFCGDDDFIVPKIALDAVGILESDSSVRSVNGRALYIHLNKQDGLSFRNYRQRACIGSDWIERLEKYVRPYSSTFYTVQRTDDVRDTFESIVRYGIEYRFGEIFAAFTNIIRGNTIQTDSLFLVRGTNETVRASSKSERFSSYLFNPNFTHALNTFLNGILDYAESVHGSLPKDAGPRVKKVFSDLLAINYLCDPGERHQITIEEDEGPDQQLWTKRLEDPNHADTLILKDIAERYVKLHK